MFSRLAATEYIDSKFVHCWYFGQ